VEIDGVAKGDPPKKHAFVVIGMHRSGTSAMTRVLALCGAVLPENLMAPHADNPAGYWEPKDLVDLNDKFLADLNSAWDDIFIYDPRLARELASAENCKLALESIFRNYGDAPTIVLKDPRISVLAPFWNDVLKQAGYEPVYIIMVRHPWETAESLRVRDGFSSAKGAMLWASYMFAAERDTRDTSRVFVDFQMLMDNPALVLDRIQRHSWASVLEHIDLVEAEVGNFLDEKLYHHHAPSHLLWKKEVWTVVPELYDWFAAASVSIDPLAPSSVLDGVKRRMDDVLASAGTVLRTDPTIVFKLRAEVQEVRRVLGVTHDAYVSTFNQAAAAREAWDAERVALLAQAESYRTELQLARSALQAAEEARARLEMKAALYQLQAAKITSG